MGGVAKSHNSSQMNLSGSSSSLTSDASTKAVSLRSYGIGGAILHKRVLLMTQQSRSRERDRQAEEEEEEDKPDRSEAAKEDEETAEVQRGSCSSSEQRRGRSRLQKAQADSQLRQQAVRAVHPGSPTRPSPIRTRLMSPFRKLRDRSQSGGRRQAVRIPVDSEEEAGEVSPSSPSPAEEGLAVERRRRSVSPSVFLWLCRDRHGRGDTV